MNILFLCVGNSARSQMAEGLAKSYFGKEAKVMSAGSQPTGEVHPVAIQVLGEMNIDIADYRSKSVTEIPQSFIDQLDYVVTLCAEEVCPVIPSTAKKLQWAFNDPAKAPEHDIVPYFRLVRDGIIDQLKALDS
ncbi:MAG: low molecular weight phosphatase family protein [Bdellovibrionaceae bacterium]|nr:low molecular weight phosphatase family protein [Pseudobdellovibrionaceae bacterium]